MRQTTTNTALVARVRSYDADLRGRLARGYAIAAGSRELARRAAKPDQARETRRAA